MPHYFVAEHVAPLVIINVARTAGTVISFTLFMVVQLHEIDRDIDRD
jgi:hypothetical protein